MKDSTARFFRSAALFILVYAACSPGAEAFRISRPPVVASISIAAQPPLGVGSTATYSAVARDVTGRP
ncbi:MAG: hypothetical protein ACM3ZT_01020, partial [Bacillota bacterium]